jgi:hypothetical protein
LFVAISVATIPMPTAKATTAIPMLMTIPFRSDVHRNKRERGEVTGITYLLDKAWRRVASGERR